MCLSSGMNNKVVYQKLLPALQENKATTAVQVAWIREREKDSFLFFFFVHFQKMFSFLFFFIYFF
jgi:hypothetical protein